jgi:hypothetical protein
MKLAAKMGGEYYPDYYTDRGDFKVKIGIMKLLLNTTYTIID